MAAGRDGDAVGSVLGEDVDSRRDASCPICTLPTYLGKYDRYLHISGPLGMFLFYRR